MPGWVHAAFHDYARRMPRESMINLVEIASEKRRPGKTVAQLQAAERERIVAALPQRCRRVVLDEHGDAFVTRDFTLLVSSWLSDGQDVAFVIGGADGIDADLKRSADTLLALSKMTLPQALTRIILVEQLYRAVSIIHNHPYHRG